LNCSKILINLKIILFYFSKFPADKSVKIQSEPFKEQSHVCADGDLLLAVYKLARNVSVNNPKSWDAIRPNITSGWSCSMLDPHSGLQPKRMTFG
jgi:hypothetical protein